MSVCPKIVVLTPVKNEGLILNRFLAVTTRFADGVVIADQHSTDGSREICARYPNVEVIENPGRHYSEAERQLLLIAAARRIWPGPKILLGFDADEILAADAPASADWKAMLAAKPGTVLLLEKPDLLPGLERCTRYPTNPVPLGFMDDGMTTHHPMHIHSPRVPQPEGAPRMVLPGIKVLHYAHARARTQLAKRRFYSVQENLAGTNPLRRRRAWYGKSGTEPGDALSFHGEPIPAEWMAGWEQRGIDMRSTPEEELMWQDVEVLRAMRAHGARRFWLEPIWEFDWENCRQLACSLGVTGVPEQAIHPPGVMQRALGALMDLGSAAARSPVCAAPLRWLSGKNGKNAG